MTARDILMAAGGSSQEKLYVDDVFSTYLYTGNGGSQTINNGIDLAGKGGLVWRRNRTDSGANHSLIDSARGVTAGTGSGQCSPTLSSNTVAAQIVDTTPHGGPTDITSFNSNGFSMASDWTGNGNVTGKSYVAWTFRRAPKFFDVVTYTGDGGWQQVSHSLGVQPGLIIAKAISATSNWSVWHRGATGLGATAISGLSLNANNLALYNGNMDGSQMSATSFRPNYFSDKDGVNPNANGVTYVAYLFAHDPSPDGIIQCGSFTTDVNGNATVTLGWEPQYLMVKASNAARDWQVVDNMRGLGANQSTSMSLRPNLPNAEIASLLAEISATGFNISDAASTTYIYLAIRRPNKPPKTGTEVYNAIARTGTGDAATVTGVGFAPDLVMGVRRDAGASYFFDRLRGQKYLLPYATNGEMSDTAITSFGMSGFTLSNGNLNSAPDPFVYWSFRRAPGFMDVVCAKPTSGGVLSFSHSLGVTPEMAIIKNRNGGGGSWYVYHSYLGTDYVIYLNSSSSGGKLAYAAWPTVSAASFVTSGLFMAGADYVAYLFASLPGISKVGGYIGNGGSQTINCGFATGARFILIKRADSAGDWYVWDTARGIVAANDPHLSLNTAAVEVTTDDSVDPDASGFIVNQNSATNINSSGSPYIFLAIA